MLFKVGRGALALVAALALPMGGVAARAPDGPMCSPPERIAVPRPEAPRRGEPARNPPLTGYQIALSWSPQYCGTRTNNRANKDAFQCRSGNRFGWVLHGLWPEGPTRDYPQWCRPAKIVPRHVLRQHMCMTPSEQLLQHEWAKHGTCMSPDPASYFKAASILYNALRLPDLSGGSRIATVADVRRAFNRANPAYPEASVSVQLDQGGFVKEVRLCLDRKMMPHACPSYQRGAPPSAKVRVRARP